MRRRKIEGVTIFNVSIGVLGYAEEILRNTAIEVAKVTMEYVCDLEEVYPHELWTILQYSLQHMVTYWLRTCTPSETEEMDEIVDAAIIEAVYAVMGIDFNADDVAKYRLRLPSRLKGRGLRNMTNLKRPAFLEAILDTLPRCIDMRGLNGELTKGFYNKQLKYAIGQGAYDAEGHKNA